MRYPAGSEPPEVSHEIDSDALYVLVDHDVMSGLAGGAGIDTDAALTVTAIEDVS